MFVGSGAAIGAIAVPEEPPELDERAQPALRSDAKRSPTHRTTTSRALPMPRAVPVRENDLRTRLRGSQGQSARRRQPELEKCAHSPLSGQISQRGSLRLQTSWP